MGTALDLSTHWQELEFHHRNWGRLNKDLTSRNTILTRKEVEMRTRLEQLRVCVTWKGESDIHAGCG